VISSEAKAFERAHEVHRKWWDENRFGILDIWDEVAL
jgi:hypothetical protein